MPSCSPERTGGFSLIEVLFALAVVGLALGTAATVFRAGLIGNETASGVDRALELAQAKLDEAGADPPLQPGVSTGAFGPFQWRLSIVRSDDDEAEAAALPLFRIEARVLWRDGVRQREVALDTLRLGPAAPP